MMLQAARQRCGGAVALQRDCFSWSCRGQVGDCLVCAPTGCRGLPGRRIGSLEVRPQACLSAMCRWAAVARTAAPFPAVRCPSVDRYGALRLFHFHALPRRPYWVT